MILDEALLLHLAQCLGDESLLEYCRLHLRRVCVPAASHTQTDTREGGGMGWIEEDLLLIGEAVRASQGLVEQGSQPRRPRRIGPVGVADALVHTEVEHLPHA